jgi:hypothetical protein
VCPARGGHTRLERIARSGQRPKGLCPDAPKKYRPLRLFPL